MLQQSVSSQMENGRGKTPRGVMQSVNVPTVWHPVDHSLFSKGLLGIIFAVKWRYFTAFRYILPVKRKDRPTRAYKIEG